MRGYPRNRLTDRGDEVVAMKTAKSRGFDIRYEDAGAGPAIVLIPGWTMSAADWRDAGYVDQLRASHRVLNMDPLGNGLSAKPHAPEDYKWRDVAADVVAVLDDAGVDRAVLWGYSRGAGLAIAAAVEFPDRVAGVITNGGGNITRSFAPDSPTAAMDEAMLAGDFEPLWEEYDFSAEDRAYDTEVNDPTALAAMQVAIDRYGRSIDCGQVHAPALALVGSRDDPDHDRITAAATGAELHVLPGLNHLEAFSRLDLVMPIVRGFLAPLGL
jgi:pimeloyl-ACP methyl ester carboxylesterase